MRLSRVPYIIRAGDDAISQHGHPADIRFFGPVAMTYIITLI